MLLKLGYSLQHEELQKDGLPEQQVLALIPQNGWSLDITNLSVLEPGHLDY